MRLPTRSAPVVAVVLAATVALASCSTLETPRDPVAGAAPEARTGGTLRIGITEPGPIDPMSTTTMAGRLIASTLCDTLLVRDPKTNQLREGLADAWVTGSNGSFVTLRPLHNVKFNDGTVLNAKDISGTLRQLVAGVNASPYAALVKPFAGGVVSASEGAEQQHQADLLVESDQGGKDLAQPLNDYDVQVQAHEPNGTAAGVFAETSTAPISASAFARDPSAFRASPVCVGRYVLAKPRQPTDTVLTLVRSKDYYAKNLGFTAGGKGYADQIEFHIYRNDAAVDQAYAAGEVDIAMVTAKPPKEKVSSYQLPKIQTEPSFDPALDPPDLVRARSTGVVYLGWPRQSDPRWNNIAVRRAVSLLVDRTVLAKTLGPQAEPATGFLPPALSTYAGPSGRAPGTMYEAGPCAADVMPTTANVAAAQRVLTDAGIDLKDAEIGLSIVLPPNDSTQVSMQQLLQQQLQSGLGTTITKAPTEWRFSSKSDFSVGFGGPVGMIRTSWNTSPIAPEPGYNDSARYLRAMFGAESANGNITQWSDAVFEKTLRDLDATDKPGDRNLLVNQAVGRLCDQMPYIPLVFTAPVWRVRASLIGSALGELKTGTDGQLLLRELYLKK